MNAHAMQGEAPAAVIAVIDDESSVREAVGSLMRSAGFDVECYRSAEDFVAAECGHRAACLVLDLRLPGMSGLALQRYLGALGYRIPLVFMTACEDRGDLLRAQALRGGAAAFLHKPFGSDDLLGAVRSGMATYTKVQ
jgi:FixJ family two-component response regulator